MIFFFLSKNFFFSDLYSIIIRTFFVDYYWSNKNYLFLLGYINWVVVFFIFIIFFTSWRVDRFLDNYFYFNIIIGGFFLSIIIGHIV
jgi:hypothetical protein